MEKNERLGFCLDVACAKVGVSLQRAPAFVQREHGDLMNLVAQLEQIARSFMPEIVKP